MSVDGIGSVTLDAAAVKRSIGHGIGRDKAAAFAAVPDVLRLGRIVHREPMRGSTDGGMVYHVAAPISINGRGFVADVLVRSDSNAQRMYVHEVALKEKLQQSDFKVGAVAAEAGKRADADAGAIRSVLQGVYSVNPATISKVVDPDTGEPLVVYHGTRRAFDAFTPGKPRGAIGNPAGIYFDTNKEVAEEFAMDVDGATDERSRIVDAFVRVTGDEDGQIRKRTERGRNQLEVIAFRPEQVKSAIGNNGDFDPEDGRINFSRASGSVPQTVAEWLPDTVIADEVEKRIGGFAQQPSIRIRDTAFGQLPGVARNDNVAGAVHDGAIYLFRDQLGDRAAVQRTLFHELLYYGLRRIFSRAQFIREMQSLYERDAWIKARADSWATSADGRRAALYGGEEYATARGVDEALARLAEPNAGEYPRMKAA